MATGLPLPFACLCTIHLWPAYHGAVVGPCEPSIKSGLQHIAMPRTNCMFGVYQMWYS